MWSRQYGSDVLADGQSGRSGRRRAPREIPQIEAELLGRVEELIDFVAAPGND